MDTKENNRLSSPEGELPESMLAGAEIPWTRSKPEVWTALSEEMEKGSKKRAVVRRFLPEKTWMAVAASMALLLVIGSFLRWHTREVTTGFGEKTAVILPDGSSVQLNAMSRLQYHPLWWRFDRSVMLDGEAYFEVSKGARFEVSSTHAITSVLGTTFNVLARDHYYQVTCHSGRVAVRSKTDNKDVLLHPQQEAALASDGSLSVRALTYKRDQPSWLQNTLMFSAAPLQLVFEEIERQYGIEIDCNETDLSYSGHFSLELELENVLSLLCKPFDLQYARQSDKSYIISPAHK